MVVVVVNVIAIVIAVAVVIIIGIVDLRLGLKFETFLRLLKLLPQMSKKVRCGMDIWGALPLVQLKEIMYP